MRFIFLILATIFTAYSGGICQNKVDCPTVSIIGPPQMLIPMRPAVFNVEISGPVGSKKIYYVWASSAGQISGGFGSSKIELLVGKEDEGTSITVFVKVSGLPEGCSPIASETTDVIKMLQGDPADSFGELTANEVKARIDNLFIQINDYPASEGIIVVHFNNRESESKKIRSLRFIFDAVRFRKYDITRLSLLTDTSTAPTEFVLWVAPPGADLPNNAKETNLIKGEDLVRDLRKALPKKKL